ncbi:unnamed protein product [Calicophoron daubneyi]|uniref:Uncharacterized protein n=1 Tax=Calicophoron daubneyi TaxID=300641 RepID=A0AAV2T978_CALDB
MDIRLSLPISSSKTDVVLFAPDINGSAVGYLDPSSVQITGADNSSFRKVNQSTIGRDNWGNVTVLNVTAESVSAFASSSLESNFSAHLSYTFGISINSSIKAEDNVTIFVNIIIEGARFVKNFLLRGPIPEMTIDGCPLSVHPATVFMTNVTLFLPDQRGDYTFKISGVGCSVFVVDPFIKFGEGFLRQSGTIAVSKQYDIELDLRISKSILITFTGAENGHNSNNSSLRTARSVVIKVYAQIVPNPYIKPVVNFYASMNGTVIGMASCGPDLLAFTPILYPGSYLQTATSRLDSADTATTVSFRLYIEFASNSSDGYRLKIHTGTRTCAEVTYVTVKLSTFEDKLPLLTQYNRPDDVNIVSEACTHLGVISGSVSAVVNFTLRTGCNCSGRHCIAGWALVSSNPTVHGVWHLGTNHSAPPPANVTLLTNLMSMHYFERIQPTFVSPTDGIGGIFRWICILNSSFPHPPVQLRATVTSPDLKLMDARIMNIGECLQTFVPAGLRIIFGDPKTVLINVPPIYGGKCTHPEEIVVEVYLFLVAPSAGNFSLMLGSLLDNSSANTSAVSAIAVFDVDDPLSPAIMYESPTLRLSDANTFSQSKEYSANQVSLMMASININPEVRQTYALSLGTTNTTDNKKICKPRLLSIQSGIGFPPAEYTLISKFAGTKTSNVYGGQAPTPNYGRALGTYTLIYAIPFIIRNAGKNTTDVALSLAYGPSSVTAARTVKIASTQNGSKTVAQSKYRYTNVLDFNPLSNHSVATQAAAPGETLRFLYDLNLLSPKCTNLSVSVVSNNDHQWPVEIVGFYLHSYSPSIWCLDSTIERGAKLPNSDMRLECEAMDGRTNQECRIKNVSFHGGRNLPTMDNELFRITYGVAAANSGIHAVYVYLGPIIQTGYTHYANINKPRDDKIEVKVTIVLATNLADNTIVQLRMFVQLGSYRIKDKQEICVQKPKLDLNLHIENQTTRSYYLPGESVLMTVESGPSPACQKRKLNMFRSSIFQSITLLHQVDNSSGMEVSILHSSENVLLTFEMIIVDSPNIPKYFEDAGIVVTVEMVCYIPKPYSNTMDIRRTLNSTNIKIRNHPEGECSSEFTQGTISSQITSCNSADPAQLVQQVKDYSTMGCMSPASSKKYFLLRYVTIEYGTLTFITAISVRMSTPSNIVLKLRIFQTTDGTAFTFHEEVSIEYTSALKGTAYLRSPLRSRGIRILIFTLETEDTGTTLTLDIQGCEYSGDRRVFDPQLAPADNTITKDRTLAGMYANGSRSVLFSVDRMFFCDGNTADVFNSNTPQSKCYHIHSSPQIRIYDLGLYITQILSYIPSNRYLFGISPDKESIILTRDLGKTWKTVNPLAYRWYISRHADMINATDVPFVVGPGTETECSEYDNGTVSGE